MKRIKKKYPDNLRGHVGFFTVSWIHGFSTMVFSLFMQFLTDYSGIDAALGKMGFAAAFGTVILLITRIIDAIDDPLQAWIMDRSKETKFGKYRGYTLASIFLCGMGIVIMFSLPGFVKSNAVILTSWVLFGYLLYEMGYAFNGTGPIMQKVTTDANVRTKITALMRMGVILAVIPSVFFIPIATTLNGTVGDMGRSFSLTCVIITVFSCLLSLLGVFLIKEPYHGNVTENTEAEATVWAGCLPACPRNQDICQCPEGLNQSKNQSAVQSHEKTAHLLRMRRADRRTAFLFAQRQYRHQPCRHGDDGGNDTGNAVCHVRKERSAAGGSHPQYLPRVLSKAEAATL